VGHSYVKYVKSNAKYNISGIFMVVTHASIVFLTSLFNIALMNLNRLNTLTVITVFIVVFCDARALDKALSYDISEYLKSVSCYYSHWLS
jgi:hypothetical protein